MTQRHDAVADSLSTMCVAVQQHASADDDSTTGTSLDQIYQYMRRSGRRSKEFQSDLRWPMTAAAIVMEPVENDDEEVNEDEKEPHRPPVLQFVSLYRKMQRVDTREIPESFRLVRIDEDPLEARWNVHGRPVPLHCNILGDKYAPQCDPLRFLRHEASVSETYGRMKHAVRRKLQNRKQQRIQALNDRERRRRQLEPSPEVALEAKFDRMFQNKDNGPEDDEEEKEDLSKNQLGRGRGFTQLV